MKLAACLPPRSHVLAHQHARLNLSVVQVSTGFAMVALGRRFYSTPSASFEYKWGADNLDEMRSGSMTGGRKLPKTWANTHGDKSPDDASTSIKAKSKAKASSRTHAWGRPKMNPLPWNYTDAQRDKEARLQELERGLEVYSHKCPAGPPLVSGTCFLNARSKASSSSHTLDQPLLSDDTTSRDKSARLKMPTLAYTANYDEACDLLHCLGPGPMGLDLEWNYSRAGVHRTALVQICSSSLILIIHTSAMSHRIPPLLKHILQDPSIVKTGVAIKNDALKLQRDYAIDARNVVELSNFVKLAQPHRWAGHSHLISLRDLTRIYLGRKLRKDSVRVSDWERYPLDAKQIEYAASDTFASLEVLRAAAEYFKPTAEHVCRERELLDSLDRTDQDRTSTVMHLDQALKLSAYDLYQERIAGDQAKKRKQEQQTRTALRDIQPNAQPRRCSPSNLTPTKPIEANPVETKPALTAKQAKSCSSSDKWQSDDDDFITVTRVLLAHERAMKRWLYSRQTLSQVASSSKVKVNTVARYILKALSEAESKRLPGSVLDDFTGTDQRRLAAELEEQRSQCALSLKQYRALAKTMGWQDAVDCARVRETERDSDRTGAQPVKRAEQAKSAPSSSAAVKSAAATEKQRRSALFIEISES